MFRVRAFAKRTGVTVRTLHHYDQLGLLKPSGRTAAGYRLYGERDIARLQQIVTLKFIGMPLKQIRNVLSRKSLNLAATLQLQRRVIEEKRQRLDLAVRAIERAERLVAGGQTDWDAFTNIIEVIQMQNNWEWVKKYYTKEQLADLARRGTPEVLERGQREWKALIQDVEAAVGAGEDPAGAKARALAERWTKLMEEFTGGDPGILANLRKLYADQAHWPAGAQKPYRSEVGQFICQALKNSAEC